jgi:glycosyltransferase involved in cell wall biosynthesis
MPRLSVIIPTYDRAATLERCLEALVDQTCDGEQYEVVVADDGSADETPAVTRRFVDRDAPPQVRSLRQENAGANAARNRAIEAAHGEIVLLINDDTIATPEMVAEHLAGHDRHPDDRVAVLGRVTVAPWLPPSRLARLHLDRAFASFEGRTELDWRAFFTCNVSVKKSLLDRGGMFEERVRYHEDLELSERLSHHGLRVTYRPEALGYHDHFLTEEEFFAIAAREARALTVWAEIAPHLRETLGMMGFAPALPLGRRIRHRVIGLVMNRATIPSWRWIARRCPPRLDDLSLAIYEQAYKCRLRSLIREMA